MPTLSSWHIAASLILVAIAVGVSLLQRLRQEIPILEAAARALVQLLLVGVALSLIFDSGSRTTQLAWSGVWLVAMLLFASYTVRHRVPEASMPFWLTFGAFATALAIGIAVLFGAGIFTLEARTLIPLSGMIVGNSLAASVLLVRRIIEEFRDRRSEIEARLALGLSAVDAARPHVRAAVRTALIPQIEQTKAVGIVVLPGAMTGLILAGTEPIQAVLVQITIMYLVLGAVATITAVLAAGFWRRLFTPDMRLIEIAVPADDAAPR